MENSNLIENKQLPIISCLLFILFNQFAYGFFKAEEETAQGVLTEGYLTFRSPPRLSFGTSQPRADRMNLLRLGTPVNSIPVVEQANESSLDETGFPLISYEEDSNTTAIYQIPQSEPSPVSVEEPSTNLLPPADPFVSSQDKTFESINSTDELMKLFENDSQINGSRKPSGFQFLPPYTIERGNMIMKSKATYTRKARN